MNSAKVYHFIFSRNTSKLAAYLQVIKIIRTTHSDNPYGGKGIIRMTQRDNPNTSKGLSEQPKGYR